MNDPTKDDTRAVVTQGDREIAASMMDIQGGPNTMPSYVRMGQDDGHPVVQAFARHRLAAQADAEARVEALSRLVPEIPRVGERDTYPDDYVLAINVYAGDLRAARRALNPQEAGS